MKRFTRYAIGATLVLGVSGAWAQQRDLEPGSRQGGSQRPRVRTIRIRGGANAGQADAPGQGQGPVTHSFR